MATGTYLDAIVARHRRRAALDGRSLDELIRAASTAPAVRGFRDALANGDSLAVIAEIKRRSPSKGPLRPDLDPAELARRYAGGGARCLSVLTDEDHFGGSRDDLVAARSATALPVLRKDFTVDPRDVCDARLMGADCVLLIVAALEASELREFLAIADEVGIDALVEVHDERELETALACGPAMVGVNQRDLVSFAVDRERAVRLAATIPDDVVAVAESGVGGRGDARTLREAGYDAVLVGEHLVTSDDPGASVADLIVP